MTAVSDNDLISLPFTTALGNNYPNPFNPTTTISFSVSENSTVQIDIYNTKGQKVRNLVNGVYNTGKHSVIWNGTDDKGISVGSGVYFYRMRSDNYNSIKRMILLK
jgi:flagellar hook assembly protein FlgD